MVITSYIILLNLAGEFVAELEAGTSWIGLLNGMVLELRYILLLKFKQFSVSEITKPFLEMECMIDKSSNTQSRAAVQEEMG